VRATVSRFVGSGVRIVGLGLGLLAVVPVGGCHRGGGGAASAADGAAVKRSFDELNGRLKTLEAQFGDLRKKIETIPPELPNYRETRETFFATEEGRGVVDAKMTLLATRLDAAMASRKPDELQDLAKELTATSASVNQLEQLYVTLLHQVMALQRSAEKRASANAATGGGATAKPTGKRDGGKVK